MDSFKRMKYAAAGAASAALGRDVYRVAKNSLSSNTWLSRRKYQKRTRYIDLYRPLLSYDVKRNLTDIPFTTYATNIQHYYGLGQMSQGTDINQRLRQIVQPVALDIDFTWKNIFTWFEVVRWAVIQPRSNRDISGTNINNEFFRGANAIRAVDFDQVFKGSHKQSYPINLDIYKVFAEGTFGLTGVAAGPGNVYAGKSVYRLRKKIFFPKGTKILYEGPTSADDQTAPIFVWWLTRPETNSITANEGLATVGPMDAGGHLILHYKEMV